MKKNRKNPLNNISILILIITCVLVSGSAFFNKQNYFLTQTKKTSENKEFKRDSLNLYEKLKNKRKISILVIGDSIAESTGSSTNKAWFKILQERLRQSYGVDSNLQQITAGGSTVSRGWVEYNRNFLKKDFDLVFLCFGQNDQGNIQIEDFQIFYENMIRRIKSNRPETEIFPIIESSIRYNNKFINTIKDLSSYYSLDCADTRKVFENSFKEYEQLTKDKIHPNDLGYSLYIQLFEDMIKKNYFINKKIKYSNQKSFYSNTYLLNSFKFLSSPYEIKGFETKESVFISNRIGDSISFKINGEYAIVSYMNSKHGGKFKVYVDNKFIKEINTNLPYNLNWTSIISNKFESGHIVKIVTTDVSTGHNVCILGIATN